jgi:hypothetical protein
VRRWKSKEVQDLLAGLSQQPGGSWAQPDPGVAGEGGKQRRQSRDGLGLPDGPPAQRPFPPEHRERILATVMAGITSKKHLNPRRRHRTYPRVIKRARHNSYHVKRPGDHGTRHPGPATIKLVGLQPACTRSMIRLRLSGPRKLTRPLARACVCEAG